LSIVWRNSDDKGRTAVRPYREENAILLCHKGISDNLRISVLLAFKIVNLCRDSSANVRNSDMINGFRLLD
jgi:hypothetical protein